MPCKGYVPTPEHRRALSEAAKRRYAKPEEHKPLSEEHRAKIGDANRGRKRSRAARQRDRRAALARWARVRAEQARPIPHNDDQENGI